MDSLLELLKSSANEPIDTLVYLGAEAATVETLRTLAARQLVLVQGDPDEAAELRLASHPLGPRVKVCAEVVSPQGGPTRWHRYNFSALNGTVDASALLRYYPRLRPLGVLSVRSLALAALLEPLLATPTQGTCILVLDLPGQEAGLLASLPPEMLRNFSLLLVRGCTQQLGDSSSTFGDCSAWLDTQCWTLATSSPQADPLWPVGLWRYDMARHQQQLRDQRLIEAELLLEDLRAELARSLAEKAQLTNLAKVEQEQLLTRLFASEGELEQLRSSVAQLAQQAQSRDRHITEVESHLQRALSDKAQLADLARADQEQLLAQLRDCEQELKQLRDMSSQLTQRFSSQERQLSEQQSELDRQHQTLALQTIQLQQANARAQELEQAVLRHVTEQQKAASIRLDNERELQRLTPRLAELEDALAQSQEQRQRDQQRVEEGRRLVAERMARVMQLEKALEELGTAGEQTRTALDLSLAQLAERTAQVNALEQALAVCNKELDRLRADQASAQQLQAAAGQAAQSLQSELEQSSAEVKALRHQLDSGKQELQTSQQNVQSARTEVQLALADRDNQTARLKDQVTQIDSLQERNLALEQALDQARQALADIDLEGREVQKQALQLELDAARKDLVRATSEAKQLSSDRDAQAKLATEKSVQANERHKRIQVLEIELADAQQRLALMHQELAKADGQLDLVRELLLQEPSL